MKLPRHIPPGLCRWYSKPAFLFVPNNEKYVFENEKLTPEQNDAAIPSKPIIESAIKYHHDMKNPEDVADVVTKFEFNDYLVSALSRNATLFGGSNHKFVIKGESSQGISLYYSNMAKNWVDIFNGQIIQLSDITAKNDDLNLSSNMDQISQKYHESFNIDDLEQFYKSLGATVASGAMEYFEVRGNGAPSFETASVFLIKHVKQEELSVLLSYIEAKLENCSLQGCSEILKAFIDRARSSNSTTSQGPLMMSLYTNAVGLFPPILSSLSPDQLDNLAYLLSKHGNTEQSKVILGTLIQEQKLCPSQDTLDAYVSQLENRKDTLSYGEFVTELNILKPAFFHARLTPTIFKVLLGVVTDRTELDQLLRLVRVKSGELVKEFHYEILAKTVEVQKGLTGLEKDIQLTQMVRLLVDENVKFGEKALGMLRKAYFKESNVESLKSLN
ncbi:uncharacterized protein CANTADRAFT_24586 [Suhomyces tanzawaensis NRRL Y-17324]|uniref:ATPase expression protein 1 n=1 Tax=Suhomyces tanzawaensis NRRL Y-17324 TaxID=984487 RepID=A0A1E4SQL4_9ASCO|nr:uncharacterized protein CANTADRAFT_24586 [Suhomyces tanzawaensis NRRL Y-17324]ODV81785.1 hypothetical protein CANTADRAFT_24586 [Suhomyces tanzawaensis NRRL Y-17324]